jgi:16S rRNA (adenine(1408)-N(1))-methyltransferase
VTVDVGTGDGRAVIAAAASEPTVLSIGLDADARSMAEASRRAARSPARGGLPNATFVVAAVEALPTELSGIAALVTVRFPWASLLRGCLGADVVVARGVAGLVAPGGELALLLAPAARDRLGGLPTDPAAVLEAARATFVGQGLTLLEGRPATAEDIDVSGSTWARRLLRGGGIPARSRPDRQAVLVRLGRPQDPERDRAPAHASSGQAPVRLALSDRASVLDAVPDATRAGPAQALAPDGDRGS